MDFLTVNIANLLATQPQGMWEFFIFGLEGAIKNYGLTIILITLIIKIIMLPFDFFNRYVTKKNASKMAVIQPEIEKIQKRYGANRDLVNQKTMEVYKKHNYSVTGSCLVMVLNLAITMTIFFTLFSGLNKIAAYKTATEFETLKSVYEQTVGGELVETKISDADSKVQIKLEDGSVIDLDEQKISLANDAVVKTYGEIKEGFLWVKNIWRPDTNASVTLNYKDYLNISRTKAEDLPEIVYNQIFDPIKSNKDFSGWNGYFILMILSAVITYLSTQVNVWIGKARASMKGEPYVDAMAQNKILIYLMPIIMALFAWFYNAMFAIYMVTGAIFGLITNPVVTLLVDKLYSKKEQNEKQKIAGSITYSRANVEKNKNANNNNEKVKTAKISKQVKEKNKPLNNEILFKKDNKQNNKKNTSKKGK